jgi:hypothetical protein
MRSGLIPGLNARWVPSTADEFAAALPAVTAPVSLYVHSGSGAPDDGIGSADLTAGGTPAFQQPGKGMLCTELGAGDKLAAGANTVHDIATSGQIAFLNYVFIPAALGANSYLFGKSTGVNGYQCVVLAANGRMRWYCGDGTVSDFDDIAVDHRGQWVLHLAVIDKDADLLRHQTNLSGGTSDEDITAVGSLTNTGTFALGNFVGTNDAENGTLFGFTAVFDYDPTSVFPILRDFFS